MFSLLKSLAEVGQSAHDGIGSGSHCGAASHPQGSTFCSQGQAAPVTTGSSSLEGKRSVKQ